MILLGIAICIFCVGLALKIIYKPYDDFASFVWMICGVFAIVIVVFALISNYYSTYAKIKEFESVDLLINTPRPLNDIEYAAIRLKAVEMNRWLAKTQYWDSLLLTDDFIPDAVRQLEPIRDAR